MAALTKAKKLINEYPVVIFSKSYCPYCDKTKALLDDEYDFGTDQKKVKGKFLIYELNKEDDGDAIQKALGGEYGQTSVPNIFIKGDHIGGNSDIQARRGELRGLLKEAGAI